MAGEGPGHPAPFDAKPDADPARHCAANATLTKAASKCTAQARFARSWGWPPPLTGGPQTQTPNASQPKAVAASADWLNATGPIAALEAARRLVALTWGPGDGPTPAPARESYALGEQWPCGVSIYWTPDELAPTDSGEANEDAPGRPHTAGLWVSIPGHAFSALDPDAQYRVLYNVARLGLRATRLDLAVDVLTDAPSDILDRVYDGSRGLEYIDAETRRRRVDADRVKWQPEAMGFQTLRQMDSHKRGERRGRTLYMGAKGKSGGGRELYIYDKGAQTGEAEPGHWVRIEMRFYKRGEYAQSALETIIASPDGWREIALDLVLSQVDFREANGRREKERRPRCAWWADFLRGLRFRAAIELRAIRRPSSIVTTLDWMQRTAIPTLRQLAKTLAGEGLPSKSIGELVDAFFEPKGIASEARAAHLHWQVRDALEEGDPEHPITIIASVLRETIHGHRRHPA